MAREDYLVNNGTVVDSFTAPDGTTYEATAGAYSTGIVKTVTNEDGTTTKTVLNLTDGLRKGSKSGAQARIRANGRNVALEFDSFKAAADAAVNTTEAISYTDANINADTGGGPFRSDKGSTVTLTDSAGNSIGTVGGRIGSNTQELANAKQLADELININKSVITTTDDELPVDDEIVVDEVPVDEIPVDEVPVDEVPVDEVPVNEVPVVSGENFTSTIPSTEVIEIGPGEVAPIDPNTPVTVVQDVAPVTYTGGGVDTTATTSGSTYVQPTVKDMTTSITSPTTGYVAGNVAPQAAVTGTFNQPLQTAELSAVPDQITYKTHYAGTQGAVPENLITNAPGTGEYISVGYQQVPYINRLTTQEIMVTEFNGRPITNVPPGFTRKFAKSSTAQAINMAEGGDVTLARKFLGFDGPPQQLDNFLQANPSSAARMGKYRQAMMSMGGQRMGAQQGTVVPKQANIAGQPHRLAYINPQEERMMKAAGGAGVPSYGGIPTYFTLSPDPNNPPEVGSVTTDPTTGYKYTWNGTSYDITDREGNPVGTTGGFGNTGDQGSTGQPAGINQDQFKAMQQGLVTQTMQPIQGGVSGIIPTSGDFIPVDAGQTVPQAPFAEVATAGAAETAGQPIMAPVIEAQFDPTKTDVKKETDALTAQTLTGLTKDVTGQTDYTTNLADLTAQTGTAKTVQEVAGEAGVPRRTLDTTTGGTGELVSGAAVDQAKVGEAFGTGEVQAASVQDELAGLMSQFEGGDTPAWAAGSMRKATQMLAARGLGASSLAGQAVIQAAMEAALPIAQIDAGNKQQTALFKAEQRSKFLGMEFDQKFQAKVINAAKVSEIANMNFTADQQIALENSRAANTMELTNLSNKQALLMSEAAALSNLELSSLNNLQSAQVENARNFLQMDMANLSNKQQTEVFKTQQNISAILNDSAQEFAASQFNATSENQTNQFFAGLSAGVAQFNASQINTMDQFNLNSTNAMRQFNSEMQNARDIFNAQNGLVIAQANAKWRQNIATLNTSAQNESNMDFAKTINALSAKNLDEIWQRERDIMSNAFVSSQSASDRALQIILGDKELESIRLQLDSEEDIAKTKFGLGLLFPDFGTKDFSIFGE